MSKKKTHSEQGRSNRNKGKRGERGVRDWLIDLGFTGCRRTAQRRGDATSDVECGQLPNLHIECKLWAVFSPIALRAALTQARRDCQAHPYCVVWRCTHQKDKKDWRLSWIHNGKLLTAIHPATCKGILIQLNALFIGRNDAET